MLDKLTTCPQCPPTKGAYGKPALFAAPASRLEQALGRMRLQCEKCGTQFSLEVTCLTAKN